MADWHVEGKQSDDESHFAGDSYFVLCKIVIFFEF